jgi:hypothetical protein
MMTRSGVARALRRSIATVRRMEGTLLHPVRDARGVHWFAPAEVDRLVLWQRRGQLQLFRPDVHEFLRRSAHQAQPKLDDLQTLRGENAELRRQLEDLVAEVTALADDSTRP